MYCTSREQAKAGDPSMLACLRKLQSLVVWNHIVTHTPSYSTLTHPEQVQLAVTARSRISYTLFFFKPPWYTQQLNNIFC